MTAADLIMKINSAATKENLTNLNGYSCLVAQWLHYCRQLFVNKLAWGLGISWCLLSTISYADYALTQHYKVKQFIAKMVQQHGFSKASLVKIIAAVRFQPEIIAKMNAPYEKKNWDNYKAIFFNEQHLKGGLEFWQANQQILAQVEKQYNVPASIIVAILGIETFYGKRQGNYRVLDALTTLAFYYPKRRNFFTKELGEYLLLCREHNVNPTQYMGSYAGAIGKPQFMPSSYRYYATTLTHSRKTDLINDNSAVIASVANYFHKNGWQMHQGIAQPAKTDSSFMKKLGKINLNARRPEYKIKQLRELGVQPLTAAMNMPNTAGLIILNTNNGPEFWLTYHNFYVITRYNNSPQYALAVFLLAQQLRRQWLALAAVPKKYAYT